MQEDFQQLGKQSKDHKVRVYMDSPQERRQ